MSAHVDLEAILPGVDLAAVQTEVSFLGFVREIRLWEEVQRLFV